jgi:hypothetical protein
VNLVEFDRQLRQRLGTSAYARPFVCDGSPLDCQAFIVGANPATDAPFWPFWTVNQGFDKAAWEVAYEQARVDRGKRAVSNTRERINRIAAAASPISCLETNVFATPTPSLGELPPTSRGSSLLAFLVESIQPLVILTHGVDAVNGVRALRLGARADVLEVKHLRFVSYTDAWQLGREINEAVLRRSS